MSARAVASLLVALLGIALPVVFLLLRHGLDDRVAASSLTATQFLELLGTMAVAFVCGLVAAALLRSATPTLGQVLRDALRDGHKA
jgi:hypothetical protein